LKLLDGMTRRGLSEEYAQRVFEQIRGFGEYGFPESHSASFALLVYVSAWLKHYYPDAFAAALLNSQPMGFYAPAQLVRDAREHGVEARPVDVNESEWDCTLEELGDGCALRLGFRQLRGLPKKEAAAIVEARRAGPFCSVEDFARRTGLGRATIMRLAKADAFNSLQLDRRGALWQALGQHRDRPLPLFDRLPAAEVEAWPSELPALAPFEEVVADYRAAGLSLKGHPMAFLRPRLVELRVTPAASLARTQSGSWVRVAGLVLVRQRPGTASGITFVTLEDETGVANLIVRPDVWERYRRAASTSTAIVAHGRLERHGQVIHVLTSKLEDLAPVTQRLTTQSRDFR
jgi:error-prone DNA polymerase